MKGGINSWSADNRTSFVRVRVETAVNRRSKELHMLNMAWSTIKVTTQVSDPVFSDSKKQADPVFLEINKNQRHAIVNIKFCSVQNYILLDLNDKEMKKEVYSY